MFGDLFLMLLGSAVGDPCSDEGRDRCYRMHLAYQQSEEIIDRNGFCKGDPPSLSDRRLYGNPCDGCPHRTPTHNPGYESYAAFCRRIKRQKRIAKIKSFFGKS